MARKPEEESQLAGMIPVRETAQAAQGMAERNAFNLAAREFEMLANAMKEKGEPVPANSIIRRLAMG